MTNACDAKLWRQSHIQELMMNPGLSVVVSHNMSHPLSNQGSLLVLSTLSSPTSMRNPKEKQFYMLMLVFCLVCPNVLVFIKSLWRCTFKSFVKPNMKTMLGARRRVNHGDALRRQADGCDAWRQHVGHSPQRQESDQKQEKMVTGTAHSWFQTVPLNRFYLTYL